MYYMYYVLYILTRKPKYEFIIFGGKSPAVKVWDCVKYITET